MDFETKYRISKFIGNMTFPFRNFYRRICFFLFWGWTLKDSHDWDHYHLYDLLFIKMNRMRKALAEGSTEKRVLARKLKKMDVAIGLCKKLRDDDYSENTDKVEQKWGKLQFVTDPTNNPKIYRGRFFNQNALNPEQQKQADKDRSKAVKADYRKQERDRKKLFTIIADNIETWWD